MIPTSRYKRMVENCHAILGYEHVNEGGSQQLSKTYYAQVTSLDQAFLLRSHSIYTMYYYMVRCHVNYATSWCSSPRHQQLTINVSTKPHLRPQTRITLRQGH